MTESAASTKNARIRRIMDTSLITLLSKFSGTIIVVDAIGIDVHRPITMDKELRITLERFLYVAKL